MKKFILQSAMLLLPLLLSGQAMPGGIAFVGFNSDGSQGFAFIVLQQIPDGQTIYFTDNEWTGSAFNTGEGFITWVNNSGSAVTPGTVVTIHSTTSIPPSVLAGPGPAVGPGTATRTGNFTLADNNEVIYAYVGTSTTTPTVFLAAIASSGFDASSGGATLSGTGLVLGETASAFAELEADVDIAVYIGSTDCNALTLTQCATLFNTVNAANWETDKNGGDQSQDGMGADFPAPAGGSAMGLISASIDIPISYGVLPIKLVLFEGYRHEASIHLRWRTATEQNNDYMAVERSADGVKFTELGRVKGAGTTEEPQAYRFVDEKPLPGLNYYRLRQADYDGAYEYHKTIGVLFDSKTNGLGIQAFPNPVQDQLQARWAAAPGQPTTLRLLDMTGRQLATYEAAAGVNTFEVPLGSLPTGLYFLQVSQGQESEALCFRKE
ncbi:MAG: T9SS type A sorting domain-containing protein [Lewinellaceae bacterium]|nr:T9SS type A sorting domain-containing protein [Lewinellaceae bacterium]